MFAALFLVISMVTGFALVLALVPRVMQKKILTVAGEKARNPFFALFPACFLSGTALVTWLTYIVGCLLKNTKHPLGYANAVVMPVCFVIAVVIIRMCKSRVRFRELFKSLKPTTSEMVYFAVSLAASVVLMIASFRVVHGEICIGLPVIEDFALHVNLIRSFSEWEKLPAQYPYFTNAGINYHFMMDFLAGNLEFLGLRIDFAYNVPSILAMTAFFCGVYECFFRLCGRKNYCHIVWLLVMFRSSWGFFRFLADNKGNLKDAFANNQTYMGATHNEWWGIYQSNALINQRHLIFGYAVAMFVVSLFLPYLIRGVNERREIRKQLSSAGENGVKRSGFGQWFSYLAEVFRREALPRKKVSVLTAVFAGVCLGMCGLFSAHSVIGALLILFVFAWFSSDQVSYLITAAIACAMTYTETALCTGSMNAFRIRFVKAWVLEDTSLTAVLKHFWLLFGLLIPVLIFWFIRTDAVRRIVLAASVLLFAFGFHVQMSPTMMQNHKYMLLAIYWFGILSGIALCGLITYGKKRASRILCILSAIVLFIPLTATGVYDFVLVLDKCRLTNSYRYESTPPFLTWARENGVTRNTLFLAPDNFIGMINIAGVQNYVGYHGFINDAGYDAEERDLIVTRILHASRDFQLIGAVEESGADYLVIQRRLRVNDEGLNEEIIASVFPKVFSLWDDVNEFSVYDLHGRIAAQ